LKNKEDEIDMLREESGQLDRLKMLENRIEDLEKEK
jgi:hypothetical protein